MPRKWKKKTVETRRSKEEGRKDNETHAPTSEADILHQEQELGLVNSFFCQDSDLLVHKMSALLGEVRNRRKSEAKIPH